MKKKLKKKIRFLIILLLLLFLLFLIFLYLFIIRKPKVIFTDNLTAEINSYVKISDYIKEIKNGKLITKNNKIDTSSLGKKNIIVEIESKNKTTKYELNINIVDTTKPVIEGREKLTTKVGEEINLLENTKVNDNSKEQLQLEVKGDYDIYKAGNYNLKYYAKDSSNNETSKSFTLIVEENPNLKIIKTSKGYNLFIKDGLATVNGIVIANKSYGLPENYGNGLTSKFLENFNKMKEDAKKEGINISIISGFRTYNYQKNLYNKYVNQDGKALADTYSARPGHSEHQTGLAADINSLQQSFEFTKEGAWLNNNSYKYGFILRYPKGKEDITGYMFEPWHFRYVGDIAKDIYNNGSWITLEEYFGIDSKYQ